MACFDITPYWWPEDPWLLASDPENILCTYDFKYRLAALIKPASVLEIGVRAGYSAAAFLMGSEGTSYYGVDADVTEWGGSPGATSYAQEMLGRLFATRQVKIEIMDTQVAIPQGRDYDLAHVDGCHGYDGCLADLHRVFDMGCKWCLVDDILLHEEVASAVKKFVGDLHLNHVYFDTWRGDCLINLKSLVD